MVITTKIIIIVTGNKSSLTPTLTSSSKLPQFPLPLPPLFSSALMPVLVSPDLRSNSRLPPRPPAPAEKNIKGFDQKIFVSSVYLPPGPPPPRGAPRPGPPRPRPLPPPRIWPPSSPSRRTSPPSRLRWLFRSSRGPSAALRASSTRLPSNRLFLWLFSLSEINS